MKSFSDSPIIKGIGKVQDFIIQILLIIIPVLVTLQVLLRYVFHAPLMGIEEILLFPAIWLYFLGGSSASKERNHIDCGVLVLYIKTEKPCSLQDCQNAHLCNCWQLGNLLGLLVFPVFINQMEAV